ncbi:MAG TPA: Pycsar system effector family protein [Chitinophagaceae bacterium]|jgi:predicted metal-dependent HD superfamily phosphohydrolase|nr:Pycsar system effector family protein [Chitinophagaceae bacterium]
MAENQEKILQEAEAFVTDLLTHKLSESIRFHTLQHTQEVVAACQVLADFHQLPVSDRLPLMLAAWFHDTGYTGGEAKDHETVSIELANSFFTAHTVPEDIKNKAIGCINATRMPQSPDTLLQKIICDADLFHLGTNDFKEKNRLLREEIQLFGGKELSKEDWRKINIRFLDGHKYFTKYGKDKLEPVKDEHLARLRQKDKNTADMKPEKKEKEKIKDKEALDEKKAEAAKAKAKAEKEKQSERGISTVFRIVAQNQNNLSGMADSKANILISVNSIILSIIIGSFASKLESNPNLLIPVIVLVIVCVSAIVFAILATRPNVTHGTFTEDDIRNKKTNLLFFGNFYKMSLKDYDWAMQEMLADKDYLYASIAKDNYFLGVVLARKYRFLRYAYNIFMFGLIIAMVAFAIAMMIPTATEVYTPG